MQRFWEIDFVRGVTVVAMVLFNWLFALSFFGLISFDSSQGFWWGFARVVAGTFIFVAGLSLAIASQFKLQEQILARGVKLLALGLGITLLTLLVLKQGAILFGILHLIGISTILSLALAKFDEKILLALGIVCIALGVLLSGLIFEFPWLLWLGFVPTDFYTLDYFPLLPWFGVFLLGMAFGKKHYSKRKPSSNESFLARLFCFLGRHSLAIYLVHQPLLMVILLAFGVRLSL